MLFAGNLPRRNEKQAAKNGTPALTNVAYVFHFIEMNVFQ